MTSITEPDLPPRPQTKDKTLEGIPYVFALSLCLTPPQSKPYSLLQQRDNSDNSSFEKSALAIATMAKILKQSHIFRDCRSRPGLWEESLGDIRYS